MPAHFGLPVASGPDPLPELASLHDALRACPVVTLHFAHRFTEELPHGHFAADVWRSLFGLCLAQRSPTSFDHLMGRHTGARHWSLRPPLPWTVRINRGDLVHAAITLFGEKALHFVEDCQGAIADMGERGFGATRIAATLETLTLHRATLSPWNASPPMMDDDAARTVVDFESPLAIGWPAPPHETVVGTRDVMPLLAQALARRLTSIHPVLRSLPNPRAGTVRDHLQGTIGPWPVVSADLRSVEHFRRSTTSGSSMAMRGVMGRVVLADGDVMQRRWLALAALLQLGARTTFGFGQLRVSAMPSS